MANNIVTVNVTQTNAPTPSTLQKTGAFISQGGTTTAANTITLLTQTASLASILSTPLAITTMTWSTGIVTVTTTAPHGLTTSSVYQLSIQGATPAGYNGSYACTATGASTFTFALAVNPGTNTVPGTWTPTSTVELVAMNTTFFAQGTGQAAYVLELGITTTAAAISALTTFINNSPQFFYAYLVPRAWDAAASFLTLIQSFSANTSKTYFYVTTTSATYTSYTALMKCVYSEIEAPTVVPTTEFTIAATFWNALNTNPSSTNKVAPMSFRYVSGVTPFSVIGNNTNFANWKAAFTNIILTGAEGGISNACVFWGTMEDGNPWNYWYSVDWLQINADLNATNEVINGSNNPINPLYLNQDGINRVQARLAATVSSGITFGLVLGQVVQTSLDSTTFSQQLNAGAFAGQAVINAIPFVAYYTANPGDYTTGTYNGYSITYTPLQGFKSITINVNVTTFVVGT